MMPYEAILFDMDGVVIDTHDSVTEFWLALAVEHQLELSQADFQQHIYGCPMNHTFDMLFPHLDERQRQAIFARLEAYEVNLAYTEVPGVTALLQALKRHDIPTALVTSADWWKVRAVIDQLGLDGLFTTYVTSADIQQGKPHPEGYLLATQRLQKSPQHCLVFEDAVSGVKAAVAAGATCIGVRPHATAPALIEAGATYTIPDLTAVKLQATSDNGSQPSLHLQIGIRMSLPLLAR